MKPKKPFPDLDTLVLDSMLEYRHGGEVLHKGSGYDPTGQGFTLQAEYDRKTIEKDPRLLYGGHEGKTVMYEMLCFDIYFTLKKKGD